MSIARYSTYKHSEIPWLGDVPSHWTSVPLKAVVTHNDEVLEETTPLDTEIVYVDISGVDAVRGLVAKDTMLFAQAPSRARRRVAHGDVIVSTVRTYLKAIAAIRDPEPNLIVSTGFAVIRPKSEVLPDFLAYLLSANYFIEQVIARSTGVSYPAINASELVRIAITLPPREDQRAIATFLDREIEKVDSLIAEQHRLIAFLKEKRQAVIAHAVTKGLDSRAEMKSSGVEWLGDLPAHWDYAALTRIASRVVVGIAEAATHAYADSGVPILRSTNIRAGKIIGEILYIDPEFAGGRDSKQIMAQDLVTVRTGNAGVTAVIPPEFDGCQCFTMLITTLNKGSLPEYYCYWINSVSAQCYFQLEGWGTAQINISVPILKALPVPVPPTAEQEAIVAFLDHEVGKLDALSVQANHVIELLHERRSALISAAVTGQIDVRNMYVQVAA
jgi:type I restriction enzyme S subunit